MALLTIAVMSDLHVYDEAIDGESPSWLSTFTPRGQDDQHPISALIALVRREGLVADVLLCPGDLGDKAKPSAIQYAWECVHEVAAALKAPLVAATTGNHDCDSRYKHTDFDAKGLLQDLSPPYPLAIETDNDRYWARNFTILDRSAFRLLVLNSSAYHGQAKGGEVPEYEHGRVAPRTISKIRVALRATPSRPVNLLLCHHHPYPHSELGLQESDLMAGGHELLQLIGSGEFGSWLVIHGHKHHPKISYAGGSSGAPVVFAAGSLSAVLKGAIANLVHNQFHVIEIDLDRIGTLGLVGQIRSWDWATGGWVVPTGKSCLPSVAGFGCRTPFHLIANRLAGLLTAERIPWLNVRTQIPEIDFVLPCDFEMIRRTLQSSNISILEADGEFIEMARLV